MGDCLRPASFSALLLAASMATGAAPQTGETTGLCGVLRDVLPRVEGYLPEGARAELVMALAETLDYDSVRLNDAKAAIDDDTAAACPSERERR